MAKKITDTPSGEVRPHDLSAETNGQEAKAAELPQKPKTDEEIPAPGPEKKPKEEKSPQQIPKHAEHILKTFSNYPELYIDFQGGTFTANTPPAFRSNATLYTNPYFTKPQKP